MNENNIEKKDLEQCNHDHDHSNKHNHCLDLNHNHDHGHEHSGELCGCGASFEDSFEAEVIELSKQELKGSKSDKFYVSGVD